MSEEIQEKVKLTHKQRKAKREEFYSLKAYLYKKAQKRVVKLQERENTRQEKKAALLEKKSKPLEVTEEDIEETHEHGENCDHNHDH